MFKQIVNKVADNTNSQSLSHQFRNNRFQLFLSVISSIPRPLRILDIGGTEGFWKAMNFNEPDITITLLNLDEPTALNHPFTAIQGDATNLSAFDNQSYDIVFSNSVIEHLFTWENQQKMASEVLRVGKNHFIQTPNYWFPIEPHWVFPFFQYLPTRAKVWLTANFQLGHIPKITNTNEADLQVKEIRLLTKAEMKQLFPFSTIYCEKFMSLNKSFVAY